MFKNSIYQNLVLPAIHRLGTVAATWLVAVGIPQDQISAITGGLTAALLVAAEFALRNWGKK